MARKPTELRPIMTRIPEGLRKALARSAKANRRSMNAEIIHRLTQSFVSEDMTALWQRHLEVAAERAATTTANKVIEGLSDKIQQASQDELSLLGRMFAKTEGEDK
jgi:Arc-like DNA binding domain